MAYKLSKNFAVTMVRSSFRNEYILNTIVAVAFIRLFFSYARVLIFHNKYTTINVKLTSCQR